MQYEIIVESSFSAAHSLRGYKGKCENLHGHNWRVQVIFAKNTLDKTGLAIDFHEAKGMLEGILIQLDHKNLNEVKFFKINNPTSELIAKFVFDSLSKLTGKKCALKKVYVWETTTSCASYGV